MLMFFVELVSPIAEERSYKFLLEVFFYKKKGKQEKIEEVFHEALGKLETYDSWEFPNIKSQLVSLENFCDSKICSEIAIRRIR